MKKKTKVIKSTKDVETFLFCDEVKKKLNDFKWEDEDSLFSKHELDELSQGIKQLNLEDDEDISHHISEINKFKDIYRSDEENRYSS